MQSKKSVNYRINRISIFVFTTVLFYISLSIMVATIGLKKVDQVLESNEVVRNFWNALVKEENSFALYINEDDISLYEEIEKDKSQTEIALAEIPFDYERMSVDLYIQTQSLYRAFDAFRNLQQQMMDVNMEEGSRDYQQILSEYFKLEGYLNQYTEKLELLTMEQGARYYNKYKSWFYIIPLVSVIAGILTIFSFLYMQGFVNRVFLIPIQKLVDESIRISNKDFSGEVLHADGEDEISVLINSFEEMKNSTKNYITTMEEKHQVEKQLVETRYQMLKHQINPHFLFNTLNLISATAEIEDAKTTVKMIDTLSRLTRYNLKSQTAVMPLEQEVKVVADYMYLQRMRFGARIRYSSDIAPETMNVLIPSFVLQPIVENAVVHGISLLSKGGRVHIKTWIKGGLIWISIADTGVGMDQETCKMINDHLQNVSAADAEFMREHNQKGNGIGMANVAERIQGMYQNSGMMIYSRKDHGTVVQMYFENHFREF